MTFVGFVATMTCSAISILIPTHNRAALLRQTLDSISKLIVPADVQAELIVVANACTDDTEAVAAAAAAKLPMPHRCIVEPTPGLSVARNCAIENSSGEICAFLDDDVQLDEHWLVHLAAAFNDTPADIIGGKVDLWWQEVQRPEWFNFGLECLLSRNDKGDQVIRLPDANGVVGANFAFRRDVFRRIGEFRKELGRTGGNLLGAEESDFVARALQAGFTAYYVPDVVVRHWVPKSRATPQYLSKVAFGNAVSRVMMKDRMGLRAILRCLVGNGWLAAKHGLLGIIAMMRGDFAARMQHMAFRRTGMGGLAALRRRCFSRV